MVNTLKFQILYPIVLPILSGLANSADLIRLLQKEQSDLSLHCLLMPFCQKLGVQNFRTFTIFIQYNSSITVNVAVVGNDLKYREQKKTKFKT